MLDTLSPLPAEFLLTSTDEAIALAVDQLAELSDELHTSAVAPQWTMDQSRLAIAAIDLSRPIGTNAALAETATLMKKGDLLSASANCFGYFNPTSAMPSILGDLLAAARNPQLAVVSHATASVLIERRLIAFMCAASGLPATAAGNFTTGGSEANATALQLALLAACPKFGTEGVTAFSGAPRMYASADSHLAWIKIARAAGIGTNAVRLVPVKDGKMNIVALRKMLKADHLAGHCPVMIAATAGTTNAGAIDPLGACADLTKQAGLHFHVDAAWAGALVLDDKRKALLAGIELADSITIDAHKWLSVPMGAGIILIRDPKLPASSFAVTTGYMPAGDGADPYITTSQWSRRFIGIRLWMMLRSVGVEGYRVMFDRHFLLAEILRRELPKFGWKIIGNSPLPVVLFAHESDKLDSQQVADCLEDRGKIWLGRVDYAGRSVLRACLTSYLTDTNGIELLLEELQQVQNQLSLG